MIARADALGVAEKVLDRLNLYTERAVIAGSLRRGKAQAKDIEIVAEPIELSEGLFGTERLSLTEIRELAGRLGKVVKRGDRYIQIDDTLNSGITTDLFLVHPPAEWGVQMVIRTGPAEFSRELVTRIKGRLWRCQDGWVRDERGERVPCPTEEDFFQAADIEYLEPQERSPDRIRELSR